MRAQQAHEHRDFDACVQRQDRRIGDDDRRAFEQAEEQRRLEADASRKVFAVDRQLLAQLARDRSVAAAEQQHGFRLEIVSRDFAPLGPGVGARRGDDEGFVI